MKRTISALTVLTLAAGGAIAATTLPSNAVKIPTSVTGVYHVPPITCEDETACVLDFNGNGALQGYWMARRANGTKWVRLTMVAGYDNTYVAPITCATEDSCVQDYYWPPGLGLGRYWMARQDSGTTWVRETLVPGTGV